MGIPTKVTELPDTVPWNTLGLAGAPLYGLVPLLGATVGQPKMFGQTSWGAGLGLVGLAAAPGSSTIRRASLAPVELNTRLVTLVLRKTVIFAWGS